MNGVARILGWLTQAAVPWFPAATGADLFWLALSLAGLPVTLWNLADALDAWRWAIRHAADDPALQEVAGAGVAKAVGFLAIDVVCVGIGAAAVVNWRGFPLLLVAGLLLVRLLLPAVALRDRQLRKRVLALGRSTPPPGGGEAQEGPAA